MRAVCACTLAVAIGCDAKPPPAKAPPADELPAVTMWGIDPAAWTCDLIAPLEQLAVALGVAPRAIDSPMGTAPGTPRPCTYVAERAAPEAWSIDLDCRPTALRTGAALFTEYAAANREQIAAFDAATGGKVVVDDAGVEQHAVAPPREVAVGKQGLDHHGLQVLFIDDDAPCYVRVSGPDPDRRLAVAQLVAKNLTVVNAPMRPYPAPNSAGPK